jgi:site-specific DNA recombinase
MVVDPNCKNKNWKMNELDTIIFDEIRKLATDPEYFHVIQKEKAETSDSPNKIDILKKEIRNIDEQISRFMDLYGIGKFTIDQVSGKVDPLNEQKKGLEKELEALNADLNVMTEAEVQEIVSTFSEVLESGELNAIRLAIETLISYIELDNDDVYIHWKFA